MNRNAPARLSNDVESLIVELLQSFYTPADLFQTYTAGVLKYVNEFTLPYWSALYFFNNLEKEKILRHTPWETFRDYMDLLQFNIQLADKGFSSGYKAMSDYHRTRAVKMWEAWVRTITGQKGDDHGIERCRFRLWRNDLG